MGTHFLVFYKINASVIWPDKMSGLFMRETL